MLINILFGCLAAVGVYLICQERFKIPSMKTSKAMRNLAKQKTDSSAIEVIFSNAAAFLARYLKISEFRRIKYERDLRAANVDMTPEVFVANAIVKSVPCFILAIPLYFIMPFFMIAMIILGILIVARELTSLQEKIRIRREELEYDLPHFVSTIEKTLKYNRDVLAIMEAYEENAGEAMKAELKITIADMKSGNYESALTRFESRIGSSMLSDTVRGLISVIRGDDTEFYWAALSVKFADIQRQTLKNKAVKIPGKINKLSMVLLFCFILLYFVVFGMTMIDEMGMLFEL